MTDTIDTAQAKCERVLRWLEKKDSMSSNQIGGNPAVNQQGQPVAAETQLAVAPNTALSTANVPLFMQNLPKEELGTELMRQYVSPPRMKIVQGQSGQELKREFGESSVVVVPNNVKLTEAIDFKQGPKFYDGRPHSEFIEVVPVFFYPEFCDFNPMGITPYCRERTTDPNSPLALKCRGQFEKRKRQCPGAAVGQMMTYMEVMNFICVVMNPGHFAEPCIVSMKSSDFTTGRDWCKLADIPKHVPCYGQVFELCCSPRKKEKNEWYGWDIQHAITPDNMIKFIQDEEWFNYLRSLHLEFKANYEDGMLQANYDDDVDPNAIQTTATASEPENRF